MFVVFDLDGTLSDPTHRNRVFACPERGAGHLKADMSDEDWDCYSLMAAADLPHWPMLEMLKQLRRDTFDDTHHRVEIWTGRSDIARKDTLQWLQDRGVHIHIDRLRMRPRGDHTPDFEMKRQWMEQFGKPDLVFEDRQRVVDMWRAHGVMCAQVAPGNF